jgi:hypothetical protein
LSKIVRVPADVSHRDESKPRSVDEILQRVEEQNGKEGSCRVREVLSEGKTDGMSEEPASAVHLRSDELDHLLELDGAEFGHDGRGRWIILSNAGHWRGAGVPLPCASRLSW